MQLALVDHMTDAVCLDCIHATHIHTLQNIFSDIQKYYSRVCDWMQPCTRTWQHACSEQTECCHCGPGVRLNRILTWQYEHCTRDLYLNSQKHIYTFLLKGQVPLQTGLQIQLCVLRAALLNYSGWHFTKELGNNDNINKWNHV